MVRLKNCKCDLFANVLKTYRNVKIESRTISTSNRDRQSKKFAPGYVPSDVEKGKYEEWEKRATQNTILPEGKKPFSIIMPPPNITGTLHLGHALTLTIQDVLIRWNRMKGIQTIWVPGLDHAGIATQVVVEKKLWKEKQKTRHDIGREDFEKLVHLWKDEKSDQIRKQIKNLGALPDWSKEYFTMDKKQAVAVNEAFIRLFDSGIIYRSDYLVNWSCVLRSAISDIEVEHINIQGGEKISVPGYEKLVEFGKLTKFAYKVDGEDGEVIVSTTRPETVLGDAAVAVHPKDDRYSSLRGKYVLHPFRNEKIPVIFDDFVDPEFGTGAVKVTPAHDPVDFTVGRRHGLGVVQVIDERGDIVDICGANEAGYRQPTTTGISSRFAGMRRFEAREAVVHTLNDLGLLRGVEDHPMSIPICSRSKDVVEHLVKPQWFVKCDKMAAEAVEAVRSRRLKIEPAVFEKTWFNWLENIRDWCISRQLWWGHRIPAYFCTTASSKIPEIWVAAQDEKSAREKAAKQLNIPTEDIIKVVQDDDVLDTWFSSALLPFSAFGWPHQTKDLSTMYPNSLLETGHDILFFWAARMVMLGHALTGQTPFNKILLHGVICDAHGRKMSKSLGNVIAPEEVIKGVTLKDLERQSMASQTAGLLSETELEKAISGQRKMFPSGIPQCGADALRFTLLSHNIQSHFINFDISECYTNKLFGNKIWQAVKYTRLCSDKIAPHKKAESLLIMDKWILSRLSAMVSEVNEALENHNFHLASAALKQFLYAEFCDVYVETTKPAFRGEEVGPPAAGHVQVLVQCLDTALRALAPFMPHLTDELYGHLPTRESTHVTGKASDARFPQKSEFRDVILESEVQIALDTVSVIRRLKKLANLTSKHQTKAFILSSSPIYKRFNGVIGSLSGCSEVDQITDESSIVGIKTLSDTVGVVGVVHVALPDTQVDSTKNSEDTQYLIKKIEKLVAEVRKIERMINSEGYRAKAPEKVQKQHSEKLASLKEEMQRLQNLQCS